MDKLSIFGGDKAEVTIETDAGNSLDTIANGLRRLEKEAYLLRKGKEEFDWDAEVRDSIDKDDMEEDLAVEGSTL